MADSNSTTTFNPVFTSAVNAGSNVLSTVLTNRYNEKQANLQRDWNEQMMNKQNAFSLDMWNKTNEYNSPSAQVQRLRDAGLNPLFYGLDGSSANGFESSSVLGYDRSSMSPMSNPISSGIDAAVKVAQISNIQADTAKKNNENLTETQKREKILSEIENTKQELNNLRANEKLTNAQRQSIDKAVSWMDRLNEATISEKESNAKLNDATRNRIVELLEGEKLLQARSIEDFDWRWSKISAEIDKLSKETGLLDKDIENYALNHAQSGFMGTGLSIPNLIRGLFGLDSTSNEVTDSDKMRGDAMANIVDNKL